MMSAIVAAEALLRRSEKAAPDRDLVGVIRSCRCDLLGVILIVSVGSNP